MDEAELDSFMADLESSSAWRSGAPEAARELLGQLPGSATELQRARLTLLGIDKLVRARSAADAALTILGVRDQAVRASQRALEARAEHALSVLFCEIGDPSAALEHAEAAFALDGDDLDPLLRCRLPLAMADALHEGGRADEARGRYREALVRSRTLEVPWACFQVLNNWAYAELVAGDVEAAADLADQLHQLADQSTTPMKLVHVGTVAEILHTRGRSSEAITLLRKSLRDDTPKALFDAADCWVILADVERATGALGDAGTSLSVAERLSTAHELPALRVEVLRSRAELLAAAGDHAGAYALHRRFHTETLQLRARASETRVLTLQAVLEVDDARRESTRYREMSYRDPLTTLYNRRYVDEDLDRRLAQGTPLAVALLDLDHFKRVNDTCSHEAGDAVLVRLAGLLETTAAGSPDAYAARLGGEEFLLVLPERDLADAQEIAERLRRDIAGLDWSTVAPDVPVTASIGLAVTPGTGRHRVDRGGLLRDADRHLYAAKDAGRNRVEPRVAQFAARTPVSSAGPTVDVIDGRQDRETTELAGVDGDVARLLGDLEASYEGHDDAPAVRRELLAQLPDTDATWVQRAQLTLLGVDELIRDHGAAEAARIAVTIRDRASVGGHRAVQAGASRALSWLFRKVGDPSVALEHAVSALALDGDDLDPALRCRVRLVMADALGECGSFDDAAPHFHDALVHARSLGTPWLSILVVNNWAYGELEAGDLEAAAELAEQMQAIAREHGVPLDLGAVETAAEVLHARGRSDEAVAILRKRLNEDRRHGPITAAGCWLTLAQIERETGDLAAAGPSLDMADRLIAAHAIHTLGVEALGERAELLAALGDHVGAYDAHRRFHSETLELRTRTGEARAQTLHAMLEVDVARSESTRFRELSYRDALTGLLNRRHVDEDLDRRLAATAGPAQPLSVALIDLDHFKRVNDTCSHEAGDAVLTRLARLLETAAAGIPDAYAARLGGEEFLLVLPGLDLSSAHEVAEDLRRLIAVHDWSDLAPEVPVTASIGVATTPHPAGASRDRADLLHHADVHLYAAKGAGRNRVEPSSSRPVGHGRDETPLPQTCG